MPTNGLPTRANGLVKVIRVIHHPEHEWHRQLPRYQVLRLQRSYHLGASQFGCHHQHGPVLNNTNLIIERPKVIYNTSTKLYVRRAHWDMESCTGASGGYCDSEAVVFTSPTVDGHDVELELLPSMVHQPRDRGRHDQQAEVAGLIGS